jgi:hypothetical protein
MRFVHVMRDGRDLAFGKETAYRIATGGAGFGVYSAAGAIAAGEAGHQPAAVRMAAFWSAVNLLAAEYGEQKMGENYYRVRLEDMCANPEVVVRDLFAFLKAGASDDLIRETAADVVWPKTIGLHRRVKDLALLERVTATSAPALERFRYAGARFERPERRPESMPDDALPDEHA